MSRTVALLRAVNVGGTGKLPMADLRALAEDAGLQEVETYIASGNLVFRTDLGEVEVKARLEAGLLDRMGKPVAVFLRSAEELRAILRANPFADRDPSRVAVVFLDGPPPEDAADAARGRADEEIRTGQREIYIHYPSGMGRSKLTLPVDAPGTTRNVNTVSRLAVMAAED